MDGATESLSGASLVRMEGYVSFAKRSDMYAKLAKCLKHDGSTGASPASGARRGHRLGVGVSPRLMTMLGVAVVVIIIIIAVVPLIVVEVEVELDQL